MDDRVIQARLDAIRRRSVAAAEPITGWEVRTADYLAPGSYRMHGGWRPGGRECRWPAGATGFVRGEAVRPEPRPGTTLFLSVESRDLEGLLSIDGSPWAGVDAHHQRVRAPQARAFRYEIELISVPRSLSQPALLRETCLLREIRFDHVDERIEAAWYDLLLCSQACGAALDERRRRRLGAALEDALLSIDLTLPPEPFAEAVAAARALLAGRLESIKPDPEAGRVFLAGHTHIDTAWLWPLSETVRKCARTFSTACRLMERYPGFCFSCSQPQLYEYTRDHYPQLYAEIRKWVASGRWETTGGMWVEADCNVPSGESLIRQVLHGLAFYRRELGTRPTVCWLPDVFGYPASLPQILLGCGLRSFYTNKLHWQARNRFPHSLFWWQGIDGSRLVAHVPLLQDYYNGRLAADRLAYAWEHFPQKEAYDEVMLPYGYGDGGGGPTEEMAELAARMAAYPGLPACRDGIEEGYFSRVFERSPELPVWEGELYLETHRGTLTSQGRTKRANRLNETLLRNAEIAGSVARLLGAGVDLAALGPLWRELLLLQFHDILPGSSIGRVYAEAEEQHGRIAQRASAVLEAALAALARPEAAAGGGDVVVVNTQTGRRTGLVRCRLPGARSGAALAGPGGELLPLQVLEGGECLFVARGVPGIGLAAYRLAGAAPKAAPAVRAAVDRLESPFFVVELDGDGAITRLLDKRCGREVVPEGAKANELQLFQDGPERESAWNLHQVYNRKRYPFQGESSKSVAESGPVRAVVRVVRRHRESVITQDMAVYAEIPRIDFATHVEWRERQVLLKAAFPAAVRSARATFEIQFGAVERPTHRNTSWDQEKFEVAGHRWADLSEPGYGVSLLNDCKYGYDVHGAVLRLSLLRGPEYPDPEADLGPHDFVYSLVPHMGSWCEGGTLEQAADLNCPLIARAGAAGAAPARRAFVEVSGPALLETLKPAEDGDGWILRLYEPCGARGRVEVIAAWPLGRVEACNLVEEEGAPVASAGRRFGFDISPFQIRTFRVSFDA